MYWWNLQDILKNYAPSEYRNYVRAVGGEDEFGADEEMKKAYDYGSDVYNWVAALTYRAYREESWQFGASNTHEYMTDDGEVRQYGPPQP